MLPQSRERSKTSSAFLLTPFILFTAQAAGGKLILFRKHLFYLNCWPFENLRWERNIEADIILINDAINTFNCLEVCLLHKYCLGDDTYCYYMKQSTDRFPLQSWYLQMTTCYYSFFASAMRLLTFFQEDFTCSRAINSLPPKSTPRFWPSRRVIWTSIKR